MAGFVWGPTGTGIYSLPFPVPQVSLPMRDQPQTLPLPLARLVDAACDRHEAACRAGQSPRIEECFADIPEEARPTLLRELLRVEADYRQVPPPPGAHADYLVRLAALGEWVVPILAEF